MATRWAGERGTLWERGLTGDRVDPVSAAVPVRWEEPGTDRAEELALAMGLGDPGAVLKRMAGGRRAFTGRVDGSIACYGWVSAGSECIGELERAIRLPPREAYVWDCLTLPAYRRLGLYTSLLTQIARTMQAEGFGRLWIGSSLRNRPSIRGFESAGFRPVLQVAYGRAGSATAFVTCPYGRAPLDRVAAARAVLARPGELGFGPLAVGRLRPGSPELPWSAGTDH